MKQPTLYLLSCGDEILFGQIVDSNAAWLAEQATILGWRVIGHHTVGDVHADIVASFLEAAEKADFVIHTGGLGPTQDDRTRFALAEAMGVELYLDEAAIKEIEEVFRGYNMPMGEQNRVQAMFPDGSVRIVNPGGTAPGIKARLRDATVFCLPGVPREMRRMFDADIRPLMDGAPGAHCQVLRQLHMCGRGESDLGREISHLMGERANPEVGTAVSDSIITVRIYAKGNSIEEARAVADAAEAEIRRVHGPEIFGVDGETLAQAVYALLMKENATLITAESCTGGMLSSLLVDVPGVSDVFLEGAVTYSNHAKIRRLDVDPALIEQHGAVSREVVGAMAENPLRHGDFIGPVYSLATTGIAGPDGGTPEKPVGTIWVGCSHLAADGRGFTRVMRYNTVADRHSTRKRGCYAALDLLRRTMLGLPVRHWMEETPWRREPGTGKPA